MTISIKSLVVGLGSLAFAAGLAGSAAAGAGFIALEGSDATTYHQDPQYTPQLFMYLQGGSSLNVLVLNAGSGPAIGQAGVGLTAVGSLSGVTLSNYSAIYVESKYGCCTADQSLLNGFGASVNAFVAAGGNLSIENYGGGSYDGVVPGGAGSNSSNTSGTGCSDGELVTSDGIAKGFAQPPVDGCWSHQGYDNAYWGAFGYKNLISSAPAYGFTDGSSFLATGGTLGGPIPEPATWALMLVGIGGVGFAMRSSRKAVKAV